MNEETGESMSERPLRRGEVAVFSEENFGGTQQRLTTTAPAANPDFPVASIQLGPGTGVTLTAAAGETGLYQDLTVELASFTGSRLQGHKPEKVKIWLAADHPYRGDWAIEVAGRYLGVSPDGVLTTNATVTDYEIFRLSEVEELPGAIRFTPCGIVDQSGTGARQPAALTIDDFQSVVLSIKPEAGFRKFSLQSVDGRSVCYNPDEEIFFFEAGAAQPAIFSKSIKIAQDESQVGEVGEGEVALYENPCYWGKAWVFHADYADFSKVAGLNDQVSSIQIGPLTGVTVYRDVLTEAQAASAPKQDVTTSIPSLKDEQVKEDQISAMDLWRIVVTEDTGVTFTCKLSQDVHQSGGSAVEYSAYRTTLHFPSSVETVELWATDDTDLEVDGVVKHVSEDRSITLKPNVMRSLVIASDALGNLDEGTPRGCLRAPGLKIRTNTMGPDERIVIYPDREVHTRLASLKENELFNAKFQDANGDEHSVIKDPGGQKLKDVANAQSMITKVMSTVKYTSNTAGGWDQTISARDWGGKSFALDFSTYRVTVRTLFVREGPDTRYPKKGYLMRNQVVEVLGFNTMGDWVNIRRLSDGLTGWSYGAYLGIIHETPAEDQYRVKALMLQVREGPGTIHRQVGILYQDEIVTGISMNEKGTWIKIVREQDNLTGWCSAQYLEATGPVSFAAGEGNLSFAVPEAAGAVPAQPPGISGLAPVVQFREASPEEVQALLARAVFPEAGLAQGLGSIFKKIFNAVKSAVKVVVTAIEKTWAVFIDLGKDVLGWVVDTAEKAVACVEAIIEKIGAAIEEIVKWLRFLFNWQDILRTRNYLRKSIDTMLGYIEGTLVKKAEQPVENCFEQLKSTVTNAFNDVIERFGGSTQAGSSGSPPGTSDAFKAIDWLLSKMAGGAAAVFGTGSLFNYHYPASEDEDLRKFWNGQLGNALALVSAPQAGLTNALGELLRNPSQPQRVLAVLLTMLRDQAVRVLELGKGLVQGLLKVTQYLIEKIKALLNAELRIPFISDLIEWIGTLLHKDLTATLGFSIMDAATLILAIPVTILSKARLGRAPFAGVPDLALDVDGWNITCGLAGYLNSLVSIPLDMTPESDDEALGKLGTVLESFSLVFSLICLTTNWGPNIAQVTSSTQHPPRDKEDKEADWMWWTLFGYDVFVFVLDCGAFIVQYRDQGNPERAKRSEKPMIIFSSILGGVHLALLVWKDIKEQDYLDILTDGLMTLPEVCAALRLSNSIYVSLASGIIQGAAGTTSLAMGLAA